MNVLIISEVELPSDFTLRLASYFEGLLEFTVVEADLSRIWRRHLNPVRGQVKADSFLNEFSSFVRIHYPGYGKYVGIVNADGYVTGLNFVFGLAMGNTAVVFTHRLVGNLMHTRILKEVIHEVGHTLGLGHCSDPYCIMYFSNTLADTDRKGPGFCPRCRVKLRYVLSVKI